MKRTYFIVIFLFASFHCLSQNQFSRIYKLGETGSAWHYDTLPQLFESDTGYYMYGQSGSIYVDHINDTGHIVSRNTLTKGLIDNWVPRGIFSTITDEGQLMGIGRISFDTAFITSYDVRNKAFNWNLATIGINPFEFHIDTLSEKKTAINTSQPGLFAYPRILILDSLGNLYKALQFEGGPRGTAEFILQISPSELLIGIRGWIDTLQGGIFIMNLDTSGNILWQKRFCGWRDRIIDAVLSPDSTFTVLVEIDPLCSLDSSCHDYHALVKMDFEGNILWSKRFFNPNESVYPRAMDLCADSGYVVAFNNFHFRTGWGWGFSMCLGKMDKNGDVEWIRRYRGSPTDFNEYISDVIQTRDGGYAFLGYCWRYLPPTCPVACWDTYFAKTDSLGQSNSCYDSTITSFYSTCSFILDTLPSMYTVSYPTVFTDTVTVLDTITGMPSEFNPCTITGIQETFSQATLKLHPNPADTYINVEIDGMHEKKLVVAIRNAYGQLTKKMQINQNNFQVDISSYSSGLYFLQILTEDASFSEKLVIE